MSLVASLTILHAFAGASVANAMEGGNAKPLKIFIMAGQSNMQGQANVATLAGLAMDPNTKPLYDQLVDENGKPRVHQNVYIAAFSQQGAWGAPVVDKQKCGQLTVGYGNDTTSDDILGPELAFGVTVHENLKEPILIIKTAWGGKSLLHNFRPPSAGPHKDETAGQYYRLMIKHVKEVLADPGKYCPAYDPKQGHTIAGFAWFQGFNDMIDSGAYPDGVKGKPGGYGLYTELLCSFIRDVRKELNTPEMPFAIGVLGINGKGAKASTHVFRQAMAAPAELPEFKGTVAAVHTADFWDERLADLDFRGYVTSPKGERFDREDKYADLRKKLAPLQEEYAATTGRTAQAIAKRAELKQKLKDITFTPEEQEYLSKNKSNATFHYLGSAKIYSQIGKALAEAIVKMNRK